MKQLIIILIILILIVYLRGSEFFGIGDKQVGGYYIIEWTAPSFAETYSIRIKDGDTIIDSADNLTQTKYLFKTGDWNKTYNISVNAVNKEGAGPAVTTTLNSGSGPFLPITNIDLLSTNNNKFVAGTPFGTSFVLRVKWNSEVTNSDGLKGVTFGVSGKFTSVDGFTCNVVPTNIQTTYDPDGDFNGRITGIRLDGDRCRGLIIPIKEGDKLEIQLTFDNKFGTTTFKKEFVAKSGKPSAPENLKVDFVKQ